MSGNLRRDARVDANQADVIDALKRVGVSVEVIGKPVDLLICCRGETSLMEVKNPERTSDDPKSRLTKDQAEFLARWPGKVHIVRSVAEAIRAAIGEEACR